MKFLSSTLLWAVLGLLFAALAPFCIESKYWLGVLTFVAINTMLAVGLNLLMGYAGQISLGHAAFFGIGAYSTAILTTHYHVSPWLALPAGILLTCLIALLIGLPCLRLHGHYLAMATLGFGVIVYIVMREWDITGGTSGIESIPKLLVGHPTFDTAVSLWKWTVDEVTGKRTFLLNPDVYSFYMVWLALIPVLTISANIVRSRVGRALRALHSSENAAASLGVDIPRFKVMVFVLSAGFAALAGSLYAHVVGFISPSVFGFGLSVELVVMVVIGGMASVWGALIGAGTITFLVEWLRYLGQAVPFLKGKEFDVVVHGLILILVMIFMPAGLTVGVRDLVLRLFRRKRREPAAPPAREAARV